MTLTVRGQQWLLDSSRNRNWTYLTNSSSSSLYFGLHTGDPATSQNELGYMGYSRFNIPRNQSYYDFISNYISNGRRIEIADMLTESIPNKPTHVGFWTEQTGGLLLDTVPFSPPILFPITTTDSIEFVRRTFRLAFHPGTNVTAFEPDSLSFRGFLRHSNGALEISLQTAAGVNTVRPDISENEITIARNPGYARVRLNPGNSNDASNWDAATESQRLTGEINFPYATADWQDIPTHFTLGFDRTDNRSVVQCAFPNPVPQLTMGQRYEIPANTIRFTAATYVASMGG